MRFEFVDQVIESGEDYLISTKAVTLAEEYLADHFPTFPVLPGVLMLECMVQAARRFLEMREGAEGSPRVLAGVRALKYGRFVRPGEVARVEVRRLKPPDPAPDSEIEFRGTVSVIGDDANSAATGRFSLRRARPLLPSPARGGAGPSDGTDGVAPR